MKFETVSVGLNMNRKIHYICGKQNFLYLIKSLK